MNYSISFQCFRNHCKHYYFIYNSDMKKISRCKKLTKKEFGGGFTEIHNMDGMDNIKCTEGQCPIFKRLELLHPF